MKTRIGRIGVIIRRLLTEGVGYGGEYPVYDQQFASG